MLRRIGIASLSWVFIGLASIHAQPVTPLEPDQSANGMLEMRVRQVFDPEPPRRKIDPPKEPVWHGTIEITVKNVSRGVVRFIEGEGTYQFSVMESGGNPAPLTEYGKKVLTPRQGPPSFSGPVSSFDLEPGQELTRETHLSAVYKIEPGQAYTIRVRCSRGFPMVNPEGWPVMPPRRELRVTLEIPAQTLPH
jgi:hypothetical protein